MERTWEAVCGFAQPRASSWPILHAPELESASRRGKCGDPGTNKGLSQLEKHNMV